MIDAVRITVLIVVLVLIIIAGTLGYFKNGDDVRKDDWYQTCTLGPILRRN